MGGGKKKRFFQATSRKPSESSASGLFVGGGLLSDWQLETTPAKGRNPRNGNVNSKSGSKHGNTDRSKTSGSKSESQKRGRNAVGYVYATVESQEEAQTSLDNNGDSNLRESHPTVLVNSKETEIVAFFDQKPSTEYPNLEFTYNYNTSSELDGSSHKGLGFWDEAEATPPGVFGSVSKKEEKDGCCCDSYSSEMEMDADVGYICEGSTRTINDSLAETSSPEKNSGFLSIGGMKLYTQDISEGEAGEDDGKELLDEESLESSGAAASARSSDISSSDDSSEIDSDIDEEVAKDYFEGIGGSKKNVDVEQLMKQVLGVSDGVDISSHSFDGTLEKLGGIALQDASSEYGMKKPQSVRKYSVEDLKPRVPKYARSFPLDDLMLIKDPRRVTAKKKHAARFPQSWPFEAQKTKSFHKFSGEKKKHRKEKIALKRRERMIRRGIDLEQINLKLQQMVIDGVDMFSFQSMHSRDCSQVRRLAAIYRFQSSCQGSGKKRFVTVVRTGQTCMPSSCDKLRLEKLIGAGNEDADFTVFDGQSAKRNRNTGKKAGRGAHSSPQELLKSAKSKSLDNSANHGSSSEAGSRKKRSGKRASYAAQPVSFISSGVMQSDTFDNQIDNSKETSDTPESRVSATSSTYGAFELHTTGFGSKMMAKMGFIEGGGLGKDGQGVAEPIEVMQRPKSLGLGAKAPETNSKSANNESQKFAAFEKHTKGFGSKMMVKMGFVGGTGLGKDSQGMVNPLAAVRLPKSRGLGART